MSDGYRRDDKLGSEMPLFHDLYVSFPVSKNKGKKMILTVSVVKKDTLGSKSLVVRQSGGSLVILYNKNLCISV